MSLIDMGESKRRIMVRGDLDISQSDSMGHQSSVARSFNQFIFMSHLFYSAVKLFLVSSNHTLLHLERGYSYGSL